MKKLRNIFIVLSLANLLHAQDLHFSQFNENPNLINPALCGTYNPIRISTAYRSQWNTYRTMGISFESRFNTSEWEQVDQFRTMTFKKRTTSRLAGGISIYSDKAGDGNFDQTLINAGLSSSIPISKQSFISVGMLGNITQKKINNSKLIFPNQIPGGQLDPNIGSGENFASSNYTYADLALGALWAFEKKGNQDVDRQLKAKTGISFYHLVQSRHDFIEPSNEKQYLKTIIHGDYTFGIFNTNKAISPSFILTLQKPYKELVFGLMLKNYFNDNSHYTGIVKSSCFSYGISYRSRDAFIINTLFEWKQQYAIGFSYDLTVSKYSKYNSMMGGFEISLRFTSPKAFLYQKKRSPSGDEPK